MKEAFEEQRLLLVKVLNEVNGKLNKEEEMNKRTMALFSNEIQNINEKVDTKIKSFENDFSKICKRQSDIIDKGLVNQYNKVVLNTLSFKEFISLDDELKEHIIKELIKYSVGENYLENIEKYNSISPFFCKLFDQFRPENENVKIFELIKNIFAYQGKFTVGAMSILFLYKKGLLDKYLSICFESFDAILNVFDEILFDFEYPCIEFEGIMKMILDFKNKFKSNSGKIIISLGINNNDFFEKKI